MAIINIGLNGFINYTITNNRCNNDNSGKIDINQISFDNLYSNFIDYVIIWSSPLLTDPDQIRSNGDSIINLLAGNYTFTIQSLNTSASLGPFTLTVTQPTPFQITKVDFTEFSCEGSGSGAIELSGGVAPYTLNINGSIISQSSTQIIIDNLQPGTQAISIVDKNGCSPYNLTNIDLNNINIRDANFYVIDYTVLPPELLDGYGFLSISVQGYGPFTFSFKGPTEIAFSALDNNNFIFDTTTNTYQYVFNNILSPGTYDIFIQNPLGCVVQTSITIPNLVPMTTAITTRANTQYNSFVAQSALPIFNTIFIPFSNLQSNSDLWTLIQKFIHNGKIDIKINDNETQYAIVRNFLAPYCVQDNLIEVVRLGNSMKDWFFCFYVAPGINLISNTQIIGANISLIDKKNHQEYPIVLGLDEDEAISSEKPSLLIGSLTIPGTDNNFYDGIDAYVSISNTRPETQDNNAIKIQNIKTSNYYNLYSLGYNLCIYFLEDFNTITENLDINFSACSISNENYKYIVNIKNLLLDLNNFNNYQNLYVYNNNFITNNGLVSIFINGNLTIPKNGTIINNNYDISYFSFDNKSESLLTFYKNNKPVKGTILDKISSGYVLVRIYDINNNKPKFIALNNNATQTYDEHYIEMLNFLQIYNPKIKNLFQYGDIIIKVPDSNEQNLGLPLSPITIEFDEIITDRYTIDNAEIIKQSNISENSAVININTSIPEAVCYLLGPKNYKQQFIGNTIFQNVIPGVYNIVGDETYLRDNYLQQNNFKIIALKNREYNLSINFQSYKDKILTEEIK